MWLQVAKNLAFSIASNPGFPFQILSHGYWQNWHNLERKAWVNFSPKLWDKICLGLRIHVLDCATVFSDSYAMCWDALRAFPAWLNALLALCTKTLSRLIASVDKKSWLCQCVGRKLGWRVRYKASHDKEPVTASSPLTWVVLPLPVSPTITTVRYFSTR